MKLYLTLSLALLSFSIFAQNSSKLSVHHEVNDFVSQLISQKIDTICDYEVHDSKTDVFYTQYILWKENGKTRIKKIEYGKDFPIIETEAEGIWKYLFLNNETIKNEDINSFSYKTSEDKIVTFASESNYSRNVIYYTKGEITRFSISNFDLQKDERLDGRIVENIYFEHNNNLRGTILLNQLENLIQKLHREKRFKKFKKLKTSPASEATDP